MVPKELVSIFNDHELELIISGLPEVDVTDLKANTEYTGATASVIALGDGVTCTGYTAASQVIQWFWSVVEEFDAENLAMMLQFVTGHSVFELPVLTVFGVRDIQGTLRWISESSRHFWSPEVSDSQVLCVQ